MEQINLHIKPRPPFRLDLTVWALRRQPHNNIEQWDGQIYTRAFVVDGVPLKVEVTQENPPREPRLSVLVSGTKLILRDKVKRDVVSLLKKILGTDEDLGAIFMYLKSLPPAQPKK